MDTGASRDPSKSLLPSIEGTGQKGRHSSLNDQVEAENPSEVSAKEAHRDIESIKRAKPLAVSKNGRSRQTFLPFDRIENTDQTAKASQRASQNEETIEAPQRAGKKDETKPKALKSTPAYIPIRSVTQLGVCSRGRQRWIPS